MTEEKDTNDYKELHTKLRNEINTSRDNYRKQLTATKELLEQKKQEITLLEIRFRKLEGAVESCDILLTKALPDNSKK